MATLFYTNLKYISNIIGDKLFKHKLYIFSFILYWLYLCICVVPNSVKHLVSSSSNEHKDIVIYKRLILQPA